MKMDPFIEAEEAAGHSVAERLSPVRGLQVRLLPAPQRRPFAPRRHRRRAARADPRHPRRVRRHLRRPAGPPGAAAPPRGLRAAPGDQADAPGRPRGPLQEALAQDDRPRPRRRGGTRPDPAPLRPVREIDPRYVGDITYIATWEGWAYLATVIDLASRRVVGWALADHMRTELISDALTMAFAHVRRRGVIFHSDRAVSTPAGLRRPGPGQRRRALGRSQGRVLGQRGGRIVLRHHQARAHRPRAWPTITGLRRAVFDYIEGWYNTRRLHSTLGYLSPAQYEAVHHNADRQAA